MFRIRLFAASVQTMMIRFYLMLFVVLIGMLLQSFWTLLIGIPIFLLGLLGVKLEKISKVLP